MKKHVVAIIVVFGLLIGSVVLSYNTLLRKSPSSSSEQGNVTKTEVDLPNATKEDGKVNVYFFWGDGCPHCAKETRFFEEIKAEYGDKFNLYALETWSNEENADLMKTIAKELGDDGKGVPYTVIGDKSFRGFSEDSEDGILAAIEKYSQTDIDVYIGQIRDVTK